MVRSVSKNRIVRNLFNKLTPIYNDIEKGLYWGLADKWRQLAIDATAIEKPKRVLDACCGSGQLAIMLSQVFGPSCHVVGIDISPEMVNEAKQRVRELHLHRRIEIKTENAEIMPFPNEFFNSVYVTFGLRFASDIRTVLKEAFRVLQPGGTLLVLELAKPTNFFMRSFTHFMREYWFPIWTRIRFGMPLAMSHHLHDSLLHYPDADKLGRMMIRCGFDDVEYQQLNKGIATLHRAFKPGKED